MIDKKLQEVYTLDLLAKAMAEASSMGGWEKYAVYYAGMPDTGDEELDQAIADLYIANEKVYLLANKLRIRHEIDW